MSTTFTAKKVILTSFFVDLADILIGVVVVFLTGSIVMLAELIQGVSDMISSGLLLIGLKSSKDKVYIWALVSALIMLLFASTLSFYYGFRRYQDPEIIDNIFLAFALLTFNFFSNGYAFYLSAKRISPKKGIFKSFKDFRNSKFLLTKNTFVFDLMGISAALVGLLALIIYKLTGNLKFDGLGAMGIGIVLGILSLDLIYSILKVKKMKPPLIEEL